MLKKFLLFPVLLIVIFVCINYSFLSFHLVSSTTDSIASLSILQSKNPKNGDLIFRRGVSLESQIVLLSDGESEYSHIGIIYIINGKPFVIHSVPAESEIENECIRLEVLEDFLSGDKASKFALYRFNNELHDESQTAGSFAYDCYLHKYSFDNDYDLKSNTKLYCTELVWKAYKHAGVDLVENRYKRINFIMINKNMIMPSSLTESKLLKIIYSN